MPVPHGVLDEQGEEAAQPVLGVGAGVEVDAHDPQLTGVFPGAFGFVLVLGLFHIGLSVTPTLTMWAGCTEPALRLLVSFGSSFIFVSERLFSFSVGDRKVGRNPL